MHVDHRGGTERGEVAGDQIIERGGRAYWTSEPSLDRGRLDLAAATPGSPRRDEDERLHIAKGVGERFGGLVGPALVQELAQLADGDRPFRQHCASCIQKSFAVDPGDLAAERAA